MRVLDRRAKAQGTRELMNKHPVLGAMRFHDGYPTSPDWLHVQSCSFITEHYLHICHDKYCYYNKGVGHQPMLSNRTWGYLAKRPGF